MNEDGRDQPPQLAVPDFGQAWAKGEVAVVKSVMNRPMIGWGSFPSLDKMKTMTLIAMSTKVSGPNP